MAKKNILLYQKLIPHYRVEFFYQLFLKEGVFVCYSRPRNRSTWAKEDIKFDFPTLKVRRLFYRDNDQAIIQFILPQLIFYRPGIVITEASISYLTMWFLKFWQFFFRYKLIMWSHGVKNKDIARPFQTNASRIMLKNYNRADALILYSRSRKDILVNSLRNKEKVFVAPNTLNTVKFSSLLEDFERAGKAQLKKDIGFSAKYNLIYIGRLVKDKGIDMLIEGLIPELVNLDFRLHIVGDGPEKEELMTMGEEYESLIFHGSIYDEGLTGRMLFASDLFVMPGYVGLSVVHAMSFGCPVITLKSQKETGPFHSPEAEYIHDGINGLFVDKNGPGFASCIRELLENEEVLEAMQQNAILTIKEEASLESMVNGFSKAIKYVS